jgi:hypothetical protein
METTLELPRLLRFLDISFTNNESAQSTMYDKTCVQERLRVGAICGELNGSTGFFWLDRILHNPGNSILFMSISSFAQS